MPSSVRSGLLWGLVAATVLSYVTTWIVHLTMNGSVLENAPYEGGGLVAFAFALPALAALVWTAHRPDDVSPSWKSAGTALAAIMALDLVTGLLMTVITLASSDLRQHWHLPVALTHTLDLAVKALIGWAAFTLVGGRSHVRVATGQLTGGTNPQLTGQSSTQQGLEPSRQPAWQPDQASGGAWLRAGDAATGASAATWGTPGQPGGGWQAQPGRPQQPHQQQPHQQEPQHNPYQQNPYASQPQSPQPQSPQPQQQPWPTAGAQAAGQVNNPESFEEYGTVLRPAPRWSAGTDDQGGAPRREE